MDSSGNVLLAEEINAFIKKNQHLPLDKIALLLSKSPLPSSFILDQISGKKKAKYKVPTFFRNEHFIYPSQKAMEQCSSEETALFKASRYTGETLIDLSGGLGVDSYFFSKSFKKVFYVESDSKLTTQVGHNIRTLNASNITVHNETAEVFIESVDHPIDLIYIDPSRRDLNNNKKHRFQDCSPNIVDLQNDLLQRCKRLLVKSSPFLDISDALQHLTHVHRVVVVAVNNECKEVLYELALDAAMTPVIESINITANGTERLIFTRQEEEMQFIDCSLPLRYLYEPNAAVLKAGAFKTVGNRFGLYKLHPNSHLYTSATLNSAFPGRIFEVLHHGPFNLSTTEALGDKRAIILLRNFTTSVQGVLKKLRIKEGGNQHLICTTGENGKQLLIVAELVTH
jgi:hypothetical protein